MTISSMPVDSHLFGKVRPFFDRTYLDFAMSVPQRWRVGQNLYKSLIHAIGPEIRRIPTGNDNALLRASPIANLSAFFGSAGPSVMRKARSRLHLGGGGEVAQVDGLGFALQTRRDVGLRAIVDEFVNSGSFDDSIFSRPGILATLDQHYSGERDYSGLIGVLVTWVIALQYFVYGDVKSCPAQAQPQLL